MSPSLTVPLDGCVREPAARGFSRSERRCKRLATQTLEPWCRRRHQPCISAIVKTVSNCSSLHSDHACTFAWRHSAPASFDDP